MHAPSNQTAAKLVLLVTCCLTQATAQGPTSTSFLPHETYARDLEALRKRSRADAELIQQRLQSLGSDLRLVAMIPRLENASGSFADIDGDGDLDYLATEARRSGAELRLYRNEPQGWRRGGLRRKEIARLQPLVPWFLADDGSGAAAVVLPLAQPPYLILLRLNARGDFVGPPLSMAEYLPRRLSRPGGLGRTPYLIEGCDSATATSPARIRGRMTDEDARSKQDLRFVLTLDADAGVHADVRQVEPAPRMAAFPKQFVAVRSSAQCEHESAERRSIVASELADVNADGIKDLVIFSGMLSAHIFPGTWREGILTFGAELPDARAVPLEDLRLWLPVPLLAGEPLLTGEKEQPYAMAARAQLREIGFRIAQDRRFDAGFTVRSEQQRAWLCNYYAIRDRLVPVTDYRSAWPHHQDCNPLHERYRSTVLLDADHDRSPDVLSVHVGQPFVWQRPTPPERSVLPTEHLRDVEPGHLRCGIVHGLGERHDEASRVLVQFEEDVSVAAEEGSEQAIVVTEVPIRGDATRRVRYCVLLRSRQVGFFFEVAAVDPEVAQHRQYLAWLRRGERRLEMQPHYWACDANTCEASGAVGKEACDDAIQLFRMALPLAATAQKRAMVWRDVARCHVRANRIDDARHAYEHFVMVGKTIEPLASPPVDLAILFADPTFRVLHQGWCKQWPVAAIDK